jgi:hypothetical protein
LPLQKGAREQENSVFLDDNLTPWPDQCAFLASTRSLAITREVFMIRDQLCFGVRPVAIVAPGDPGLLAPPRVPALEMIDNAVAISEHPTSNRVTMSLVPSQPVAKAKGYEKTEPSLAGSNGLKRKLTGFLRCSDENGQCSLNSQAVQRFTTDC